MPKRVDAQYEIVRREGKQNMLDMDLVRLEASRHNFKELVDLASDPKKYMSYLFTGYDAKSVQNLSDEELVKAAK